MRGREGFRGKHRRSKMDEGKGGGKVINMQSLARCSYSIPRPR